MYSPNESTVCSMHTFPNNRSDVCGVAAPYCSRMENDCEIYILSAPDVLLGSSQQCPR